MLPMSTTFFRLTPPASFFTSNKLRKVLVALWRFVHHSWCSTNHKQFCGGRRPLFITALTSSATTVYVTYCYYRSTTTITTTIKTTTTEVYCQHHLSIVDSLVVPSILYLHWALPAPPNYGAFLPWFLSREEFTISFPNPVSPPAKLPTRSGPLLRF